MRLFLVLFLVILSPIFAGASEVRGGDKVFVKAQVRLDAGDSAGTNPIPYPAVVLDVDGDSLLLGKVWVSQSDVMTADEALAVHTAQIQKDPADTLALRMRAAVWLTKLDYDNVIHDLTELIRLNSSDAQAFSDRGAAWAAKLQFQNAVRDFDEAIRLDANRSTVFCNRAAVRAMRKEFAEALTDLAESIHMNPGNATAYWVRGTIRAKKGEIDASLIDLKKAIALNPSDPNAYIARSVVHCMQRNIDSAFLDGIAASMIAPRLAKAHVACGDVLLASGDLDGALSEYTTAIECDPKMAQAHFNRVVIYERQGELDRALSELTKAVLIEPKYATADYARGSASRAFGDFDNPQYDFAAAITFELDDVTGAIRRSERDKKDCVDNAIADVTLAIQSDPDDIMNYRKRAAALIEKEEFSKALDDLTEAIRRSPNEAMEYRNRAVGWAKKGVVDNAIRDFGEAIRLDPTIWDNYVHRGTLLGLKHEYDQAVTDFSEAINLDPDNLVAYRVRGDMWARKKVWDRALQDYEIVLEGNPQDVEAFIHSAAVWKEVGDLDKAISSYTEALKLHPRQHAVYGYRSVVWYHKGELDKAIRDCTEAIRLYPADAALYQSRAAAFEKKGSYAHSINDLTSALQINPKFVPVLSSFALIRACSPDPLIRDGKIAVEYAIQACELTEWKDHRSLSILAAAYAESDDFENAIKWQSATIEMASATEVEADKQVLEYFQARRPARLEIAGNRSRYRIGERVYVKEGAVAKVGQTVADQAWIPFTATVEEVDGEMLRLMQVWLHQDDVRSGLEASEFYNDLIRKDPANAVGRRYCAAISQHEGFFNDAISHYSEAIRLAPTVADSFAGRGQTWIAMGNVDQGVADLSETLRLDPRNSTACNALAWLKATSADERHRHGNEAVSLAIRACEMVGWNRWSELGLLAAACAESGDFTRAVEWAEISLALAPTTEQDRAKSRLELYKANKPYREIRTAEEEENPFSPPPRSLAQGQMPAEHADDDANPFGATEELTVGTKVFVKDDAVARRDDSVDPRTLVLPATIDEIDGDLYCLQKAWVHKAELLTPQKAIDYYTERIRLDAQRINAWERRSIAWRELGDLDAAVNDITHAIKLDPENATSYYSRGMLRITNNKTAVDIRSSLLMAIHDFSEALRIDPAFPMAHYNRGHSEWRLGDYDAATMDLTEAIRLNPNNARAHYYRGLISFGLAEFDKAQADFAEAIRLDPAYADPHNDLAWLRATCLDERYRDGKQAVEFAKKACELTHFKSFNLVDTLAAAYAETGDYANAIVWQEKAVELARGHEVVPAQRRLSHFKSNKPHREPLKKVAEFAPPTLISGAGRNTSNMAFDSTNTGNTNVETVSGTFNFNAKLDQADLVKMDRSSTSPSTATTVSTASGTTSANDELAVATHAIEIEPAVSENYIVRAEIYVTKELFENALSDYSEAIRLDSGLVGVRYKRALVHLRMGEYDFAVRDLVDEIHLDPDAVDSYTAIAWIKCAVPVRQIRDGRMAVEYATRACELTNWESAGELDVLAAAFAEVGDFDSAIRWASQVVELTSENQAQIDRLELYQSRRPCRKPPIHIPLIPILGERVFVREDAKLVTGDQPADIDSIPFPAFVEDTDGELVLVGSAWVLANDVMSALEAMEYYTEQIQQDPTNSTAWKRRGMVAREVGQLDSAIKDLTESLRLDPKSITAYLARAEMWLSTGDVEKGFKDFEAASVLNSHAACAMFAAVCDAVAWIKATCPDESHRNGQGAISIASLACESTHWKDWKNLGTLAAAYAEVGDFTNAVHWAEKSVSLSPYRQNPRALERLELYRANKAYRDEALQASNSVPMIPDDLSAADNTPPVPPVAIDP